MNYFTQKVSMFNLPSIQISSKDSQKAFTFIGSAISFVLIPEMAINFYYPAISNFDLFR